MMNQKTSYKWWWGWEPHLLEDWLEQEESTGWQLYHIDLSAIRFHFKKGTTRKVRYCVDYQTSVNPEYMGIFQDAGWQLVYSGLGWYIWSMPYKDQRPAIFTEVDSLIERNNRLSKFGSIYLAIVIALQLPMLYSSLSHGSFSHLWGLIPLYAVIFGFMGWVGVKLRRATRQLRDR